MNEPIIARTDTRVNPLPDHVRAAMAMANLIIHVTRRPDASDWIGSESTPALHDRVGEVSR